MTRTRDVPAGAAALDRIDRPGESVARLLGEIGYSNSGAVMDAILARAVDRPIAVDLTDLGPLDSAGARMLLRIDGAVTRESFRVIVREGTRVAHTLIGEQHLDGRLRFDRSVR